MAGWFAPLPMASETEALRLAPPAVTPEIRGVLFEGGEYGVGVLLGAGVIHSSFSFDVAL